MHIMPAYRYDYTSPMVDNFECWAYASDLTGSYICVCRG